MVHMSTFDRLAEWSSIVGLAGVVIALVQLVRTRRAVKATGLAIARTERRLALSQVLVLLPQLQKLEADLDAAVASTAREAVIRHLAEWRRLGSEIHGLVEDQAYAEADGLTQLQTSIVTAAASKARLLDTDSNLVGGTKAARRDIAAACEYLGALSGRLRAYSEGKDD
jgi:hypothetical protein